jgi:RNA-directed DNA polymerase
LDKKTKGMKRSGNLFGKFCSFSNLLLAYKKAKKGCRKNNETARFGFFFEKELIALSDELKNLSYQPGSFRYFTVNDPKKRTIAVAPFRDRVVHHALVNILEPIYEPCFIFDSYATRKKKGTHAAILRAQEFLGKNHWFLKMDIEKYFDSIDHHILKTLLQRKIKDFKFLRVLFRIIENGGDNGKGLPIGNLTSQFLANVYLNGFDHFAKDHSAIRHYIRYMDDFVVFSEDKIFLKSLKSTIEGYLQTELNLRLKEKSTVLNHKQNGLSFIGARIYPGTIRIHPKTLRRGKTKLKLRKFELDNGRIGEEKFVAALNSINAHLTFFSGKTFRNQIFQQAAV